MFLHVILRPPRLAALVACFAACTCVLPAAAQDATPAPVEPAERTDDEDPRVPRPVAPLVAVVPGVLVHGSGHWSTGQDRTAARLLAMEGVGLGGVLVGGTPIVLTGASRYIIGPAAAVTLAGVGLFAISFAADVYGVTAPEGGTGRPRTVAPAVETRLGLRSIHDPRFRYRTLLVQQADLRFGSLRVSPRAWFAYDDRNTRLRLEGAYRFLGPRPEGQPAAGDGTSLEVRAAVTRHAYPNEAFRITTWEVFANGRVDLDRIDPALVGSFAELGAGAALQRFDYQLPGIEIPGEYATMLLLRWSFGMYLGGPGAPDGELQLYYDHRHDGYAAGLLTPLPSAGVLGHFGLDGTMYFDRNWGVNVEAQAGSAYLAGVSLAFRELAPW